MHIIASHISKSYGRNRVFRDVSFAHGVGLMGIAGANGSGKSTLIQLVAGLMKPSSGEIRWLERGSDTDDSTVNSTERGTDRGKDLISRVGFAAPYMEYYEELTVRENLLFLQRLKSAGSRSFDGGVDESGGEKDSSKGSGKHDIQLRDPDGLIPLFDASSYLDKPYGALSTGQRQRVKMIAAGLHQPDFYCFDEAAGNLDEAGWQQLEAWLNRLKRSGKTVFIASNDSRELDKCDKIYHLKS